jgi:hypothetical protein
MLEPLPPTTSPSYGTEPSRTRIRSRTRFTAAPPAPAEHPQQVLVELEPDRVVAVDLRAAHELVLAGEDLVVGGLQPARVFAQPGSSSANCSERTLRPLVQRAEAVDDPIVVVGVGVVVGHGLASDRHHLPLVKSRSSSRLMRSKRS